MRDVYTALVARCLFPLHERLKGHTTMRHLQELETSQWWDRQMLEEFQIKRLQRFLCRIGATVPYYRDLFRRCDFDPESVTDARSLTALPVLTKQIIRANRDRLTREGARRLTPNATGGSTGEPLRFLVGADRISSDVAARCRARRWWNLDVGDSEVVLWGSPIELGQQDRLRGIRDRMLRSRLLSANGMTPQRMNEYLDKIARIRPAQIFSWPSALAELARHADETGRVMSDLGIRVAFLTAETLYEHQRRRIERVFGCRVANGYGGRDAGFVAHECPQGGMHVTAEDIIVEIVDRSGVPLPPGSPGEILITHVETEDFPFVRYRTGDVAVLDKTPCPCRRGLPLLREIHGRADDMLLSLHGARFPGQGAVHLLRDVPGLHGFKIVQEAPDLIRILLVKTGEFPDEAESTIARGLRARLGEAMRVEFETVESLPLDPSGKYRTVVSRVGVSPMQDAEENSPTTES